MIVRRSPGFAFIVVRDLLAAARAHVPIEAVNRYVELPVSEPPREGFVPFQRYGKGLDPFELARPRRPKGHVIAFGLGVNRRPSRSPERRSPAEGGKRRLSSSRASIAELVMHERFRGGTAMPAEVAAV